MKMTLKGFSHEYQAELEKTQHIIKALPESEKDWKPHEKSMSVKNLIAHIVELQTWFDNAIEKDSFDLETDYQPIAFNSFSELGQILSERSGRNLNLLKSKEDDFWLSNFTFRKGDYVIVTLPRIAFMRSILLNHFIHHRGQLTVYLRLLNIPVPGIYGPSADEQ